MPRPTKLNRELAASILTRVLNGTPPLTAARAHGVPEGTWYEWLKKGRGDQPATTLEGPDDALYREFQEALDAAVPAFESNLAELAIRRARTTAEALMVLERHPATRGQWRPPARTVEQATTISGPDGGPIRVEVGSPETEQELRDRLDSLIEFLAGVDPAPVEGPDGAPQRGAATGSPRAT
jgi:hypothetical protein